MNLYCIKCLMFTKNKIFKIKREIDGKINLCIDYSLKKIEAIDEEKLNWKV